MSVLTFSRVRVVPRTQRRFIEKIARSQNCERLRPTSVIWRKSFISGPDARSALNKKNSGCRGGENLVGKNFDFRPPAAEGSSN